MATNKNALLRFQVLDKCFSNFVKKYSFQDLLDIVNDTLSDDNPETSGIQTRQLREDIKFMRGESGYNAPIEIFRDGGKPYYRYDDKNFSINNSPLNTTEAEQLRSALSVLQRFEGAPGFEWISELRPMLQNEFGLKGEVKTVMAFESNVDYSGYKWLPVLFNAINNKQVLKIEYKPFNKEAFIVTFHPYFLKQYNNRWFVYGYSEEMKHFQWNLSLDRIQTIVDFNSKYLDDPTDWEDYLYDLIGVTRPDDAQIENIEIKVAKSQAPYIETKPLHASQKIYQQEDGSLMVKLKLIINYELISLLLSFGNSMQIISPAHLRDQLEERK